MLRFVCIIVLCYFVNMMSCVYEEKEGKFLYFAYGTNLLKKMLVMNFPQAEFYNIAVLENYRLDFTLVPPHWVGALPTICPDDQRLVWGAVWILNTYDMGLLDKQEGVFSGLYYPTNLTVTTRSGERLAVRTYQLFRNPEKLKPRKVLPPHRRPSITHLQMILYGAVEVGLPQEYVAYLQDSFPDNGKLAPLSLRIRLGHPFLD